MNSVLPTKYVEIGEVRIMIRFTNGHVGKLKKTVDPRVKQAKFQVTVT